MQHLHLRIIKVVQETPDSKSFYFDAPELNYLAGQFISVVIPDLGSGVRRAYSFSTSPLADKYPGITVKRIPNGLVSRHIHTNWKEGDLIECLHPAGKFTLPHPLKSNPVFIAAGSGIVPVFSMIKELIHAGYKHDISLVYSNRSQEYCIFRESINALQNVHPQLKVHWFFSNAFQIAKARLNGEFLDDLFQPNQQLVNQDFEIFTCGPESFMYLVEVHAKLNGIEESHFHHEIFWRDESIHPAAHKFAEGIFDVEFFLPSGRKKIKVPGNQTILAAATQQGISLPWSCSAGRCSTCQMHLKTGRVFMSRNEVLTEKDINKGMVLTCTAYPTNGPISLEFL